jgi:hypothetical protein
MKPPAALLFARPRSDGPDRLGLPAQVQSALFPAPAPYAMIDILDRRVLELERDVRARDVAISELQSRLADADRVQRAVQLYIDADMHAWQARCQAMHVDFMNFQHAALHATGGSAREDALEEKERKVAVREDALEEKERDFRPRECALEEQERKVAVREDALEEKEREFRARGDALEEHERDFRAREDALEEKERALRAREDALEEQERDFRARQDALENKVREFAAREGALRSRESAMEQRRDACMSRLEESEAKTAALSSSHDRLLAELRRERALRQEHRREAADLREQFVARAAYIQEIETRLDRFERAATLEDAPDMRASIDRLTTTAIRMLPRFTNERTVRLMKPVVSRMRESICVSSMAGAAAGEPSSLRRGPKDAFVLFNASRRQLVDVFSLTVGRALRRIAEPVPTYDDLDQVARTKASVAYVHRHAVQVTAAVYYLYAMTHMRDGATRGVFRSICADAIAIGLSMTRNLDNWAREWREVQTLLRLARAYLNPYVADTTEGRGERLCGCGARDCDRCTLGRLAGVLDRPVLERIAKGDTSHLDSQRIMVRDLMNTMTERAMTVSTMIETAIQVEDMFLFDDDAELMQHILSQIAEVADIGDPFLARAAAVSPIERESR